MLVSAAAGSGKTAALVERTAERLCDEENPIGVENLLAVTFTNAAAAKMKEKIREEIAKRIALDPTNKRLRRIRLSLPYAEIRTIDSFCIRLVRENFHALGIAPDFGLLDEGELGVLRRRAINGVLDELYAKSDENFLRLCELISDEKDDEALVEAILKLHYLCASYPFPERRARALAEAFDPGVRAGDGVWGKIISDYCAKLVKSCLADVRRALELLKTEPELEEKYAPAFRSDEATVEKLSRAISGDWDEAVEACSVPIKFDSLKRAPQGSADAVKDVCKCLRDGYKKTLAELRELMCATSEEHEADMKKLAPVVKELIDAVLKFDEEFARLKREENGADFSDALRLALKLLVKPDGDGFVKTPLAESISENYAEILVDEYQDVNEAQDMIFSALSRSESNLFMVGDLKQSVYGFRRATPEIFYRRREGLPEYKDGNYPARVTLGKNFRSRKGITETVNFIFEAIMSRESGGLDYDENERLEAAASYPGTEDADAEICLIETERENFLPAQAKYAADYIENAVNGGFTTTVGGKTRKAGYGDFAVLLRSVKNDSAAFIKEFEARGIPIRLDDPENFTSSPEIAFMISLLKVIDNPADDVPLTAAAMSPVFGFTPDDMALARCGTEKGSVYQCVVSAAENGNAKAAGFLEKTRGFRRIAATVGTGELVRRLIEDTGWGAIVYAMKDGARRGANLNRFVDLANKYESAGRGGVSGFIRYLEGVAEIRGGVVGKGGGEEPAADAVRITTIHKSKGLEFPVCFIAACEKRYDEKSLKNELITAPKSGIGIKIYENGAKYDSLPRIAAKIETRRAERSEETRLLYVATTRAEEKLIMLASSQNWSSRLAKIAAGIRKEKRIEPFKAAALNNYADLLLSALIRHPDAGELRKAAGASEDIILPCKTALKAKIIEGETSETVVKAHKIAEPDEKIVKEIEKRLSYVYPYSSLDGAAAKRIASDFGAPETELKYFASRRPAFAGGNCADPAARGTATHRFMRRADYERAEKDAASELERLTDAGFFTREERALVDIKGAAKFFKSGLAGRIRKAERVYKEYAFKAAVPLREIEPSVPEDEARGETTLIEGVADCAFEEDGELVIVDFKTDRIEDARELADRYEGQLKIYKRCLSEVLGKPAKEAIIYSFNLGEIYIE